MKKLYTYFICYEKLIGKNYRYANLIYKTSNLIRTEKDIIQLKHSINKVIPAVPINIININLLSVKNNIEKIRNRVVII